MFCHENLRIGAEKHMLCRECRANIIDNWIKHCDLQLEECCIRKCMEMASCVSYFLSFVMRCMPEVCCLLVFPHLSHKRSSSWPTLAGQQALLQLGILRVICSPIISDILPCIIDTSMDGNILWNCSCLTSYLLYNLCAAAPSDMHK